MEVNDIVYEATELKKYKKWFYYYLEGVSEEKITTKEELFNEDWYMRMRNNGIDDSILSYNINMPLLEGIANMQGNQLVIDEVERLKKLYQENAKKLRDKMEQEEYDRTEM